MMSVDYMPYNPVEIEPEWMKAERYDYCDSGVSSKVTLADMWGALVKKLIRS